MDKLCENEESSQENMDFESILGTTEYGEWQEQDKEVVKESQVFVSETTANYCTIFLSIWKKLGHKTQS